MTIAIEEAEIQEQSAWIDYKLSEMQRNKAASEWMLAQQKLETLKKENQHEQRTNRTGNR